MEMTAVQERPFEVVAAVPTPFERDGAIDYDAYQRLLGAIEPWVDGVLVAGTTAEFPALDAAERLRLAGDALSVFGPLRTIVHVGAASLYQVLRLADAAKGVGAHRLAVLTPYYFPYSDDDITDFYVEVRKQIGDAEMFGYFFAERTGVRLSGSEIGAVAVAAQLDGLKISGAAWRELPAIRAVVGDTVPIHTGYDTDLAAVHQLGASGVISGLSCVDARLYRRLVEGDGDIHELASQIRQLGERTGTGIKGLKAAIQDVVGGSWHSRIPGR